MIGFPSRAAFSQRGSRTTPKVQRVDSSILHVSADENPLLMQIMSELRYRYAKLNFRYEAAFTDSFCTRRCCHRHEAVVEAAKCAVLNGEGWYVVAVEYSNALELTGRKCSCNDF